MAKTGAGTGGAIGRDWGLALRNLVLPTFCKQCGRRLLTEENGFFCPTCWESSPRVRRPFCTVCGRPHGGAVGFGTLSNFPCAECRRREAKPRPYGRIYGAALYAEAVEEAIKLFKFRDRPRLGTALGRLMAEFAAREMECSRYDVIVPVPLHRVRARDRGYNQARLLAEELTEVFPQAALTNALRRTRPTRVQSLLRDGAARVANVKGAFALTPDTRLAGRRVLLVDDVVTTAGTVTECCATLQGAKPASVDVFVAALAASTAGR